MGIFVGVVSLAGCGVSPLSGNSNSSKQSEEKTDQTMASKFDSLSSPQQQRELALAPQASTTAEPAKPAAPKEPVLKDWKKPALALVLSGEQNGYIEPCGCSENQFGGYMRRADLVDQLQDRGWTVAGLELGGMLKRNRRQSEIKWETMLDGLRTMNYQVVGLGPSELRLGAAYLLVQASNEETAKQKLAYVSANVVLFDTPGLGVITHKELDLGGVKLAVTTVIGNSVRETVFPKGAKVDVSTTDANDALKAVMPELKKLKADFNVLLSFSKLEESRAIAKAHPEFDLILSAGGTEDPDGQAEQLGNTMLVTVGKKGKHTGVVGLYPDQPSKKLAFKLITLEENRFNDAKPIVALMKLYQDRLFKEQLVAREPAIKHPSDATYVGAAKCKQCHKKSYEKWLKTPHANAYESLAHPRKGQPDYGITRVFDAECLACHVTGWDAQDVVRFDSGFLNAEFSTTEDAKKRAELLKGQQCESCHGPASRHIELINDGEDEAALKEVRITLTQAKNKVCYNCHDLDNSPNFEFDKYWDQVKHPWRD